ncbi:glutamine--fructose-6-phosphate transaminase (isomerizing), partial [bacterium]|nr:glutamine--fructose-6-phosphate transaminase (isomerizing) [bacterium]
MCGIIGYAGGKPILPLLINSLKRMEYRGYDSAGVALIEDGRFWTRKRNGRIADLEQEVGRHEGRASVGIGHTRWATHGAPTRENAHPHFDAGNRIALVHNGIIENYAQLRDELKAKGHVFRSETDSEVLAQLIGMLYNGDMALTLQEALELVQGTFGILVIASQEPGRIYAARRGSPVVIGLGGNETLVASDGAAIVEHTRDVIYLEDNEMAVVDAGGAQIKTLENKEIYRGVEQISFDLSKIQKGGFPHFMLKEIFEQPETVLDSMRGRLLTEEGTAKLGGLEGCFERIRKSSRLIITACGTSWHAGLIGEYLIERLAGLPVEVEYASEFRYRDPVLTSGDTVLAISQSGETADTLAAIREARRKGALALGMCNVVGSTIAR